MLQLVRSSQIANIKKRKKLRRSLNSSKEFKLSMKGGLTPIRERKNPIDRLLVSIDAKKREVNKLIKKNKQKMKEDKLLEAKVNEKKNTFGESYPMHDQKFIDKIREQDYWMEGPNLIDKFEKINTKIDHLKMKGFRLILNRNLSLLLLTNYFLDHLNHQKNANKEAKEKSV